MTEVEELIIAELGAQGDGVCETRWGQVYVPYTLPGERVRAKVGEGARADLVELITPSPDRVEPPCRHFGHCGGCSLQHLKWEACLAWKREQMRLAFAARGIDAPVSDVVAFPHGKRRRAMLAARRVGGGVILGFHTLRGHEIVDVTECPVLEPEIVRDLPGMRRLIGSLLSRRGQVRVVMTRAANGLVVSIEDVERGLDAGLRARLAAESAAMGLVALDVMDDRVYAAGEPVARFGTAEVVLPPGVFLQAVAEAEEAIAEIIKAAVKKAKRIADLFSGLGAFTFPLARQGQVLAVDGDKRAIAALQRAQRCAQGLKPIEARVRDLFREPLSARELQAFDAVVFDPPRAGAKAQAEMIAKSKVPVVVAVSCNPATLARDARILIDGGYKLNAVTPIDQFVYSAHIEAVAVFCR